METSENKNILEISPSSSESFVIVENSTVMTIETNDLGEFEAFEETTPKDKLDFSNPFTDENLVEAPETSNPFENFEDVDDFPSSANNNPFEEMSETNIPSEQHNPILTLPEDGSLSTMNLETMSAISTANNELIENKNTEKIMNSPSQADKSLVSEIIVPDEDIAPSSNIVASPHEIANNSEFQNINNFNNNVSNSPSSTSPVIKTQEKIEQTEFDLSYVEPINIFSANDSVKPPSRSVEFGAEEIIPVSPVVLTPDEASGMSLNFFDPLDGFAPTPVQECFENIETSVNKIDHPSESVETIGSSDYIDSDALSGFAQTPVAEVSFANDPFSCLIKTPVANKILDNDPLSGFAKTPVPQQKFESFDNDPLSGFAKTPVPQQLFESFNDDPVSGFATTPASNESFEDDPLSSLAQTSSVNKSFDDDLISGFAQAHVPKESLGDDPLSGFAITPAPRESFDVIPTSSAPRKKKAPSVVVPDVITIESFNDDPVSGFATTPASRESFDVIPTPSAPRKNKSPSEVVPGSVITIESFNDDPVSGFATTPANQSSNTGNGDPLSEFPPSPVVPEHFGSDLLPESDNDTQSQSIASDDVSVSNPFDSVKEDVTTSLNVEDGTNPFADFSDVDDDDVKATAHDLNPSEISSGLANNSNVDNIVMPPALNHDSSETIEHSFVETEQIVQPEEVSLKDDFGCDDDFNAESASNDGGFGDFGEFNNSPVKQDFGFDEIPKETESENFEEPLALDNNNVLDDQEPKTLENDGFDDFGGFVDNNESQQNDDDFGFGDPKTSENDNFGDFEAFGENENETVTKHKIEDDFGFGNDEPTKSHDDFGFGNEMEEKDNDFGFNKETTTGKDDDFGFGDEATGNDDGFGFGDDAAVIDDDFGDNNFGDFGNDNVTNTNSEKNNNDDNNNNNTKQSDGFGDFGANDDFGNQDFGDFADADFGDFGTNDGGFTPNETIGNDEDFEFGNDDFDSIINENENNSNFNSIAENDFESNFDEATESSFSNTTSPTLLPQALAEEEEEVKENITPTRSKKDNAVAGMPHNLEAIKEMVLQATQIEPIKAMPVNIPSNLNSYVAKSVSISEPDKFIWEGSSLEIRWYANIGFPIPKKKERKKKKVERHILQETENQKQVVAKEENINRPKKPIAKPARENPKPPPKPIEDPFEMFQSTTPKPKQPPPLPSSISNSNTNNPLDIFGLGTTNSSTKKSTINNTTEPTGDDLFNQALFGFGLSKKKTTEEKVSAIIQGLPDLSWISQLIDTRQESSI